MDRNATSPTYSKKTMLVRCLFAGVLAIYSFGDSFAIPPDETKRPPSFVEIGNASLPALYWNIWIEDTNRPGVEVTTLHSDTSYILKLTLASVPFQTGFPRTIFSQKVPSDLFDIIARISQSSEGDRIVLQATLLPGAQSFLVEAEQQQTLVITPRTFGPLAAEHRFTNKLITDESTVIKYKIRTKTIKGLTLGHEIKIHSPDSEINTNIRFPLCETSKPTFCVISPPMTSEASKNLDDHKGGKSEQVDLSSNEMPHNSAPTYWNVWTEQTDSISRSYKKVPHLQPGMTYLLAVDLAAVAYQGVEHRRTSASFDKEVEKWLEKDFTPEPIKLLLLLDPRFFTVVQTQVVSGGTTSSTRVAQMPIDANKLRGLSKKGWPSPEQRVQALAVRAAQREPGQASPEWLFGESTFRIVTKPGVSGPTTIGLSVWYRDRPVDEIVYSTCVLPTGSTATCHPTLKTTSLTGIDSLRVLASDSDSPDAAVHFIELGDKIKGVMHVKGGGQSDQFEDWTLSANPVGFRKQLISTYLEPIGKAASEESLGGLSIQFFDFLFPEKDAEDRDNRARRQLLTFIEPFLKGAPFPENAKSIFVRMIQQGNEPPLVIPFGLLAMDTRDPADPKKRLNKFLGSYFRIEAPLEYQDYQQPTQCISRWVAVLPPEDTGDATLNAAKKEIETTLKRWSKKEAFSSMKAFATWNSEKVTTQDETGAALVVLSHHDKNKLHFYQLTSDKDVPLTPTAIKRVLPQPSIAILNGCGTAAPEGSSMLHQFNQNGFMTIIATSTEVNGYMAGAFLKLLTQELEKDKKEKLAVSRAYFRALKSLSQLRPPSDPKKPGAGIGVSPYGALALKYTLLGNGALTFCPQQGGTP